MTSGARVFDNFFVEPYPSGLLRDVYLVTRAVLIQVKHPDNTGKANKYPPFFKHQVHVLEKAVAKR